MAVPSAPEDCLVRVLEAGEFVVSDGAYQMIELAYLDEAIRSFTLFVAYITVRLPFLAQIHSLNSK